MIRLASCLAAVALGALCLPLAEAHGIWFAQRATQTALIYGVGADDLDAVKRQRLIQSIAGFDESLQPVPTSLRAAGPLLLVDSDGEWIKKGRDEVPNAVIAEQNYKYAVQIRGPMTTPLVALPGHTLQILPQGPLPALLGKPLKLRVVFQGKPVAGARVLADYVNDPDAKPLRTAADGPVTIKVRNQGLNVVTAIHDGPSDEPAKADKMEHLATLSFVLPHLPE